VRQRKIHQILLFDRRKGPGDHLDHQFELLRNRKVPNRTRRLLAQCALLGFGINLLSIAQCATAVACCVFGAGLMLATCLPLIRYRPAAVHALIFTVLLGSGLTLLLGGRTAVTEALGRKPDLTGRTEIWNIVIPMAPNPIGGAGFETFWMGPRVVRIFELVGGPQMTNEAHNGYIELYLNLGLLGLALIGLILGQGYRTSFRAFRRDRGFGALLLAYVVTAVAYNTTEAGFRMLGMEWFMLLLSIVVGSRTAGIAKYTPRSCRRVLPASGSVDGAKWHLLLENDGQEEVFMRAGRQSSVGADPAVKIPAPTRLLTVGN